MPFTKVRKKTGGVKKNKIKKFSTSKELALERMRQKIARKWTKLVKTKIALAEGVWMMKPVKKKGKEIMTKVYQEKPDSLSLEYLFNIMIGRPADKIEYSGKVTNTLQLTDEQFDRIIKNRAKRMKIVQGTEVLTKEIPKEISETILEEIPKEISEKIPEKNYQKIS